MAVSNNILCVVQSGALNSLVIPSGAVFQAEGGISRFSGTARKPNIAASTSEHRMRPSLRRQGIHLVEKARGFQHHRAHDLQALGTQLVNGILRRVPENIVVAIHKINQIR